MYSFCGHNYVMALLIALELKQKKQLCLNGNVFLLLPNRRAVIWPISSINERWNHQPGSSLIKVARVEEQAEIRASGPVWRIT